MSSPAVFNNLPSPAAMDPLQGSGEGDDMNEEIVKRMMRVKVLYTFDEQNQTNCLARLPDALPIPVVAVDETTQIGVIELKTCIQAIVSHSPELISRLENDFTVYAYDYSEYETPLVGQGMLSRVLASASPTPNVPASQSGTMITGRVCKNIRAIFTNGVKETLEVKLKLVPVPISVQNEYVKSMETYRNLNRNIQEGFGVESWNDFMHATTGVNIDSLQSQEPHPLQNQQRANMGGVDSWHDLLVPNFSNSHGNVSTANSFCGSGPASPSVHQYTMNNQLQADTHMSRPSSRNSNRHSPADLAIYDQAQEEGHTRKRAKLTQTEWQGRPKTDWQGNPTLGSGFKSVRAEASATASIRGFRPLMENGACADEQAPRAPTPRPFEKRKRPSLVTQPHSGLRQQSVTSDHLSPYPPSDASVFDDGQGGQVPSSPEIPSSPPVYDAQDYAQPPSSPVLPEVPSYHADSGFQSDLPTDTLDTELPLDRRTAQYNRWHATRQKTIANCPWKVSTLSNTEAKAQHQPPPTDLEKNRALSAIGITRSEARTSPAPSKSRKPLERTTSLPPHQLQEMQPTQSEAKAHSGGSILAGGGQRAPPPNVNVSDSSREASAGPTSVSVTLPKRVYTKKKGKNPLGSGKLPRSRTFPRSNTWSGPASSDVDSDGPRPDNNDNRPRDSSGAIRKGTIRSQLQNAIAAGEAPKFCSNCGAIETPTWRPYWIRTEYGTGENVEVGPESSSGIHCVEELNRDEEGKVSIYRLYKTWGSLTKEEQESNMYQQCPLCNACGNWLKLKGSHRPSKLWDGPGEKKPKPKRNRKKAAVLPSSEFAEEPASNLFADPAPKSEAQPIVPPIATPIALPVTGQQQEQNAAQPTLPDIAVMGPPPNPGENDGRYQWESEAAAALSRAIRSSPAGVRATGSEDFPIELDDHLTPKPLRRLLFPSPRKDGSFKSLDGDSPGKPDDKLESSKGNPVEVIEKPRVAGGLEEVEQPDKENQAPPITPFSDDGLSHLFDFSASPHSSPSNAQILAQIIKTPTSKSKGRKVPLTPRIGDSDAFPLPATPSRIPRSSPAAAAISQSSPFTLKMTDALSGSIIGSPMQNFNFDLNFSTPGALRSSTFDFNAEEYFGTDLPLPSSPPIIGTMDYDNPFEFYEDATATIGFGGDFPSPPKALTTQAGVTNETSETEKNIPPMPEFANILSAVANNQTSIAEQAAVSASTAVADSLSVKA